MESCKVIWKDIKWKVCTQSHFYVYSFVFPHVAVEKYPCFPCEETSSTQTKLFFREILVNTCSLSYKCTELVLGRISSYQENPSCHLPGTTLVIKNRSQDRFTRGFINENLY